MSSSFEILDMVIEWFFRLLTLGLSIFLLVIAIYANKNIKGNGSQMLMIAAIINLALFFFDLLLRYVLAEWFGYGGGIQWMYRFNWFMHIVGRGLLLFGMYSIFRQYVSRMKPPSLKRSNILDDGI